MKAAGKESWTPLNSFNPSFLIAAFVKVIGWWFTYLLAFNLVDIVSTGKSIVSPIQFPSAEMNAIFTLLIYGYLIYFFTITNPFDSVKLL